MVPFNDLKRQYQRIEREVLAATKGVYEKGRYILGEEVSAFEKEFARYCGVRYGVGVGSGTEALSLSLKAAGIGEGDEVITPANSFISTALAISFTGARPLFVDIDYRTYTMDPERAGTSAQASYGKRGMGEGEGHPSRPSLRSSCRDELDSGDCESLRSPCH